MPIFAPCLTSRGEGCTPSQSAKRKEMEDKILTELETIKQYSLLAAKNVLNFEDAAVITGLSKSFLYKLTCTHQIPHYKPNGKQVYFDRAELEAWMKQNRIATQLEAEQQAINYVVKNGHPQFA